MSITSLYTVFARVIEFKPRIEKIRSRVKRRIQETPTRLEFEITGIGRSAISSHRNGQRGVIYNFIY